MSRLPVGHVCECVCACVCACVYACVREIFLRRDDMLSTTVFSELKDTPHTAITAPHTMSDAHTQTRTRTRPHTQTLKARAQTTQQIERRGERSHSGTCASLSRSLSPLLFHGHTQSQRDVYMHTHAHTHEHAHTSQRFQPRRSQQRGGLFIITSSLLFSLRLFAMHARVHQHTHTHTYTRTHVYTGM